MRRPLELRPNCLKFLTNGKMSLETFISHMEEAIEDLPEGLLEASTNYLKLEVWDSLAVLMVIAMIDTEYGVRIKGSVLKTCSSVEALYQMVQERLPE